MNPLETLQQTAAGFQNASVLIAAAELDLFTAIGASGRAPTADELARRLELDTRALTVELDALTALGFLTKRADRYRVPAKFRTALDSNNPETFIPMLRHLGACQRSWARLGSTLRSGTPPQKIAGPDGPNADRKAFFYGMNSIAVRMAPLLAADLARRLGRSFAKMLDLGGATGTYTLAFLKSGLCQRAVLFDLPPAILEAKKRLTLAENAEARPFVRLINGDFYRDPFPKGCDLHWISAIIHQQNQDATEAMFRQSFRTLRRGGLIAVRDVFAAPTRTAPKTAALFAVNMLAQTATGRVYTLDETFALLTAAGFKQPRLVRPADDMSAIVVADKP